MNGILTTIFFIAFAVLWIYPVVRGVDIAKKKNYSTAWMWFGIHPLSGWTAYSVLKGLAALRECPRCAEKVKAHAKVCPYCLYEYTAPEAAVSNSSHGAA